MPMCCRTACTSCLANDTHSLGCVPCCALVCLAAGVLAVKRVDGVPTVFPADSGEVAAEEDMLQVGHWQGH